MYYFRLKWNEVQQFPELSELSSLPEWDRGLEQCPDLAWGGKPCLSTWWTWWFPLVLQQWEACSLGADCADGNMGRVLVAAPCCVFCFVIFLLCIFTFYFHFYFFHQECDGHQQRSARGKPGWSQLAAPGHGVWLPQGNWCPVLLGCVCVLPGSMWCRDAYTLLSACPSRAGPGHCRGRSQRGILHSWGWVLWSYWRVVSLPVCGASSFPSLVRKTQPQLLNGAPVGFISDFVLFRCVITFFKWWRDVCCFLRCAAQLFSPPSLKVWVLGQAAQFVISHLLWLFFNFRHFIL